MTKTMNNKRKSTINKQYGRGLIAPSTIDVEKREVDVIFATETPVFRWGWDEDYNEILVCDESAIRMDRITGGLPVLDSHDSWNLTAQIGRTVSVWFENNKAHARVKFSQRKEADDIFNDIKDGIICNLSVGYRVYKFEKKTVENNQKYPEYRAIDWMPHEISFVSVPADVNSIVRATRADNEKNEVEIIDNNNFKFNKIRQMETLKCPHCGHEFESDAAAGSEVTCPECEKSFTVGEETVTDDEGRAATPVQTRQATPVQNTAPPPPDLAAVRAAASENERQRLNAILLSSRAAKLDDAFAIGLFQSGKPIDECRHSIITEAAKKNIVGVDARHNASVSVDGIDKKREAAADAILARAMPHKFTVKPDNPYRGQRVAGVLRSLFQERGEAVSYKTDNEIVKMAFSQRAYGTSDLPLLMEDVMNKILRGDYTFAPEHWERISRKKLVPDYREQPFYQFETANGIKQIPEGGEIPYTKMIEAKQTIKIKDYGQGFKLTRQAIINDDLDVFSEIPGRFVKDHNEFRGDLVWDMIIKNIVMYDEKPLFHADHLNLIQGADSALSEAGLKKSLMVFRGQTALGGKRRINMEPKIMIVPPALEFEARKQMAAIMATTTADVNIFHNAYEVIVERRLTDDKAWYLMADPAAVEGLYYAYLQGEEGMRAEREEKFSTDTINYMVRFNFGVAAIDWRGIVKMAGA